LAVSKSFFQNTIALVYDFDGTLSPQPMQEYTVLPKIGEKPAVFWEKVNREARETESDPMLVYMRHIIEALERERVDVKREDFAAMAGKIEYFPGVTTWFARMNAYVKRRSRGQVDDQEHQGWHHQVHRRKPCQQHTALQRNRNAM